MDMFFSNWYAFLRIIVIGVLIYAILMILLKLFGKRTLSKFTAFDLVITVALGSTLSSAIISKDVPLAEGAVALLVLCVLQFITSWVFVRSKKIERWAKAEPTLLVYRQEFLRDEMQSSRVTELDIYRALRANGKLWENVEAVVLEADGALSVVPTASSEESAGHRDVLKVLKGVRPQPEDSQGE